MSEPLSARQNHGLDELVQRIKAISDSPGPARIRSEPDKLQEFPGESISDRNRFAQHAPQQGARRDFAFPSKEELRIGDPPAPHKAPARQAPRANLANSPYPDYRQADAQSRTRSAADLASDLTGDLADEPQGANHNRSSQFRPSAPSRARTTPLSQSDPAAIQSGSTTGQPAAKQSTTSQPDASRTHQGFPLSAPVLQTYPPDTFSGRASSSRGHTSPNLDSGARSGVNGIPDSSTDPNRSKSGLQNAVNAVRSALPLVQRLLPLLDGNFSNAVNALVSAAPKGVSAPQFTPVALESTIDLAPIERSFIDVASGQRELRLQVLEQITTFKRVEDQLERVREATDRNTLEQQELVEEMRSFGKRVSRFAIAGLVLLTILIGVNVYLMIRFQQIIR